MSVFLTLEKLNLDFGKEYINLSLSVLILKKPAYLNILILAVLFFLF